MCGIAGIYHPSTSFDEAPRVVERMNDKMVHRGPDASGIFHDKRVAIGHRRLSIIDLTEAGNQPMTSANGRYVMAFNGEIYNYLEIKKQLNNQVWKSNSDSEVFLEAFAEKGQKAFNMANGMFGVAIYDKQSGSLVIARDRLGIKPVYYHTDGPVLSFASEIRALLQSPTVEGKLSVDGIIEFLRYQTVNAPNTILKGVRLLPAGHCLEYSADGDSELFKYWTLPTPTKQQPTYEEAKEKVRALFLRAVERRLVSDVPFGAFLSGGIDSTAVVGAMSKMSNTAISTYSIVFDEEDFSEQKYSRMVADLYQTDHHEIKLSVNDFKDQVVDALAAIDHPSGDGPNSYVVSKVTKESGITMALSGLGGDELFAGYDIFKRILSLDRDNKLNFIPSPFRKAAGSTLQLLRPSVKSDKIAQVLNLKTIAPAEFYPISRLINNDQRLKKLINKQHHSHFTVVGRQPEFLKPGFGRISQTSMAEMNTYMQHVLLRDVDQMSMASSLEVRVPFLDHELVEYVLSLSDELKFPDRPKKLLIDALADLIPDEVIYRPKMGFVFPWAQWLRTELKPMAEHRLDILKDSSYFDAEGIDDLMTKFQNHDPRVPYVTIWTLVVLGDWMERNNIS